MSNMIYTLFYKEPLYTEPTSRKYLKSLYYQQNKTEGTFQSVNSLKLQIITT